MLNHKIYKPCAIKDIQLFKQNVKQKKPFCFVRFSDGETEIIRNRYLKINKGVTIFQGKVSKNNYSDFDSKEFIPNLHNQIREDLSVQIHNDFKEVKKFNSNRTSTHLLSWKRREIENYFLSPTLIDRRECEASIRDKYNMPDFIEGQNLDSISDIRNGEYKAILRPLYNEEGFGFKEEMVDDLISIIPAEEISADIEKMYNYLRGIITNE